MINDWINEFPNEEGDYWFYGDPWFGGLGEDFFEGSKPDFKMYLVPIWKISNGFLGIACGQMFGTRRFNREKRQEGWVGLWKKAELPGPPDVKGLVW